MTSVNHSNSLCLVTLPSPSTSAESAKLQSKLEALRKVEKLCENYKNLNNHPNEPKKLLDNLCDGVETFVGFNKDSKGYTGQGIVYSDLDRLCDGVMGFFYNVLKDVSEKQPYSVGKNELKEIVNKLHDNLSTGRKGFEVIETVARKVGEYNKFVKKQNDAIKDPIEKLLRYVKEGNEFTEEINKIQITNAPKDLHEMVTKVDKLAEKSLKSASVLLSNLVNAERDSQAISDLNNDCSSSVIIAQKAIRNEHDRLYVAFDSERKGVQKLLKKVNEELNGVNVDINKNIEERVTALVKGIHEEFIKRKREVDAERNKLKAWIDDKTEAAEVGKTDGLKSKREVLEANRDNVAGDSVTFAQQYRKINDSLLVIKNIVQNDAKPKKLDALVNAISEGVQRVGQTLNGHVQSLNSWKSEAERAVNSAMGIVTNVVEILNGEEKKVAKKKSAVETAAAVLKQKAEKLFMAVDKASNALENTIGKAKSAVNDLDEMLKDSLGRVKGLINMGISEYVEKLGTAFGKGITGAENYYVSRGPKSGFMTLMNNFNGVSLNANTELGQWFKDIGQRNPELATAIERALNQLHNAQNQWKAESGRLTKALTADLQGKVEAFLPKESDSDRKVKLTQLTSYDGRGKGSKIELEAKIGNIETEVHRKLENIYYPENDRTKITKDSILMAHSAITRAFNEFIGVVEKLLNDRYGLNGEKDVHHYLKKLQTMVTSDRDNASFTSTLSGIHVVGLTKIESDLGKLQTIDLGSKGGKIHTPISTVGEKVALLEKASYNTNSADKVLFELVKNLPANMASLNRSITELIQIVCRTDNTLEKWLNEVGPYIDTIKPRGDECVTYLHNSADYLVSSAAMFINTEISKRYVISTKRQLQYFAIVVNDVLKPLPDMVEKDKHIGFKGFMEALEGKQESQVAAVKPQLSPSPVSALTKSRLEEFKVAVNEISAKPPFTKEHFHKLVEEFKKFYIPVHVYVNKDSVRVTEDDNKKKHPKGQDEQEYSRKLLSIYDIFNELIHHLNKNKRFDFQLHDVLDKLTSAVADLKPDGFAQPNAPVIDSLKVGLTHFVGQLRQAYVSSYDKETFRGVLVNSADTDKAELTKEGRNCANVFLTSLEILMDGLGTLRRDCQTKWKDKKICLYETDKQTQKPVNNSLGQWFQRRGYGVSGEVDKQQGELRNHTNCTSEQLIALLISNSGDKHVFKNSDPKQDRGPLGRLIGHLDTYWSVCQLRHIEKPTTPSTVRDMLHWLAGLKWHPLIRPLFLCCKELFKKPEKPEDITNSKKYKLAAYPQEVTYPDVAYALNDVSLYAQNLLIAIMGHGQEDGRYATEYRINPDDLLYPSRPSDCFDMLVDILNRVYHQLCFLLHQCQNPRTKGGWADCQYGRYVGGSRWRCNEKQCLNQTCDQQRDQIHKQIGHQHPTCGVKSPLQSFLEDGLPGFLPHTFTKPGCKWECTLSNHRGIPCKTPMGFADISIAASLTQNGAHLKNALEQFCGKSSALNKLCSMLTCVLRQPPQTLGDMFAFYSGFFNMWTGAGKAHKQAAFKDAVAEAIFGQEYPDLDPTTLFSSKTHVDAATTHAKGDLLSLVSCDGGNGILDPVGTCGPYLHPLSGDIYDVFSSSNKKVYLSWIVYLTETFYDLLSKLLEDCKSKCAGPKSRCYQKSCIENCRAVISSTETPSSEHDAQCKSIVECDYTLPNLFKYGFTFESPHKLIGGDKAATKRTCQDFCKALGKVLDKEIHLDRAFAKLIYVTIPEYLWAIRLPFFWTTVALWSLSLFYLICVMVGRLDVLHIRSHLRIPSSHKITAQSLLAAAQVGRLAKISYLQP